MSSAHLVGVPILSTHLERRRRYVMPRKGRRRMVGKWAVIEQEIRERSLALLQQQLRRAQRSMPHLPR